MIAEWMNLALVSCHLIQRLAHNRYSPNAAWNVPFPQPGEENTGEPALRDFCVLYFSLFCLMQCMVGGDLHFETLRLNNNYRAACWKELGMTVCQKILQKVMAQDLQKTALNFMSKYHVEWMRRFSLLLYGYFSENVSLKLFNVIRAHK